VDQQFAQNVLSEDVNPHRRAEGPPLGLFARQAELRRIDKHPLEGFALRFFAELDHSSAIVDLHQPKPRRIFSQSGGPPSRDVCAGVFVTRDEMAVVHSIKMVAGENQDRVALVVVEMMKTLPYRIGGALKPIGAFGCDFGRENLYKAVGETTEAIRARDMTIERRRIVLRENEDSAKIGVDTCGEGYVNQPVLSAKWYRGFRSLLR